MLRIMVAITLMTMNFSLWANYDESLGYGKSLLGGLGKVNLEPSSVPGFKGIDNHGLDNADVLEKQAPIAAQNQYGSFVSKQFNRENKVFLSDKDDLIVGADKLTKNPMESVASFFKGEVRQVKSKSSKIVKCEQSGDSYLINCKYRLKAVPYYGEKQCEEQFEKSIEVCKKSLEVKPEYSTHICEQKGNSVIKKVTATLVPNPDGMVKSPIVQRVYKPEIAYWRERHQPYRRRGKPYWNTNAYIKTRKVQVGTKEVKNWLGRGRVPIYEKQEVWHWHDVVAGYEMKHPHISIVNAEYREAPIFNSVQVLHQCKRHRSVHEIQVAGWKKILTKERKVNVPDSALKWVGDDINISGANCVKSERCIDSRDKQMYGVSIKRPCWKKEITYKCDFPSKNNCEVFRKRGCSQNSGKCLKYFEGVCVNYQNSMSCFKKFNDIWSGCESFKNRDMCQLVNTDNLEQNAKKIIAGRDVVRNYWGQKLSYACSYPALNNCEQLRLPSCKEINQKCLKVVNGACTVMQRTYKCVDGVDDSYETNCHDLENKALQGICERVGHEQDEESVKSIDGFDHSGIWERTNIFRCAYPSKNNCDVLRARGCIEKKKECLRSVSDTCVVWGKTFECGLYQQTSSKLHGDLPKCLDGSCRGDEDINDGNIGEAVAQLSALQEISKDIKGDSPSSPSIFKGDSKSCKTAPLSFNNCCRLSGWGKNIGLAACSPAEKQLSHLRAKKYCVPIGMYCAKWATAKAWCKEKRRSYCCFKGKLQRLLQVEARKQLGINWGNAKNPNCQGLSAESLQSVDFSKIDFSEVYGDVLASYNNHDAVKVQNNLKSQLTMAVNKGGYHKEPPKKNGGLV